MSGEFEAAGALATAGLAAGAIEGREPGGVHGGACLNCGAAVAGPFCSQCGQSTHPHRSLLHVFEEFLHGILHFDTKAWRTLPLLAFRPGTLTRNYIYGKRARYISPLALFLFTIFLMFFVFAFVDVNVLDVNVSAQGPAAREMRADISADIDQARTELRAAEEELAALSASRGAAEATPDQRVAEEAAARRTALARATVERLEGALARIDAPAQTPAAGAAPAGEGATPDGHASESGQSTWQQELSEAARNGDVTVGTPFPELNARILHSIENPDLALYKVQQAAYKFSFLLVPISLPFIWLLFLWRRGLTLYDHTVFTLYSLSFASLVFIVAALVNDVPWLKWGGAALVLFGMPLHMYFHLKGAYALGWWSALWRASLLIMFAAIAFTLFVVLIFLLGLGG